MLIGRNNGASAPRGECRVQCPVIHLPDIYEFKRGPRGSDAPLGISPPRLTAGIVCAGAAPYGRMVVR